MDLGTAAKRVRDFEGQSLKNVLASIEHGLQNANLKDAEQKYSAHNINKDLLVAALTLKKQVAQINVIIHAVGLLTSLPLVLKPNEVIESLSLGAGNTGKLFDLETNIQVAEFKFIDWKGEAEAIRQNSLFKDFFNLAEYKTQKKRVLYVVGLTYPMIFFNSGRAISSVLSRNNKLWNQFKNRYGARFTVVNEYYEYRKNLVEIFDISDFIKMQS